MNCLFCTTIYPNVFTARRDDFHLAPSVKRCEKLARQAKPPGETACPTHFANPCTARKVGQTVSSAGPPKSIFHTSSARGRVYWPNRPRADAWGCVAAMEYGQWLPFAASRRLAALRAE